MIALADGTLVVGLGGNVGDDAAIRARFEHARAALAAFGDVTAAPIYRSPAMGPPQPAYLNSALRVRLASPPPEPRELIDTLLELERMLGRDRDREVRWGPRTLDLDVLLWGPRVLHWRGPPELIVPHPRMAARRFALRPAADVVGFAVEVPGVGKTLDELLAAVTDQELDVVAQTW